MAVLPIVRIALVMSLSAGGAAEVPPEIHARFAAAVDAYSRGEWPAATESFRRIAADNPAAAAFAWFGFGNACVQAACAAKTPNDARPYLDEAIRAYRTVLDRPIPAPLASGDVRHNLELAKRLRWERGGSADGSGSSRSTGEQPASGAPKPMDEAPRDTKSAAPKIDEAPSRESPTAPESSDRSSRKDQGVVLKPAGGLPLTDPGPLSRQQAEERLRKALEQITAQNRERPRPARLRRPRVAGDY